MRPPHPPPAQSPRARDGARAAPLLSVVLRAYVVVLRGPGRLLELSVAGHGRAGRGGVLMRGWRYKNNFSKFDTASFLCENSKLV